MRNRAITIFNEVDKQVERLPLDADKRPAECDFATVCVDDAMTKTINSGYIHFLRHHKMGPVIVI